MNLSLFASLLRLVLPHYPVGSPSEELSRSTPLAVEVFFHRLPLQMRLDRPGDLQIECIDRTIE